MRRSLPIFALAAVGALLVPTACSKSNQNPEPAKPAAAPAPVSLPTVPQAATPGTGPAYKISLVPAWKIGEKFGYVADDSTTLPDEQMDVHFEAEGEVLALLPDGDPQKISFTVKTLRIAGPDKPLSITQGIGLKKIVVEFAADGKRSVTFDGQDSGDDVAGFLGGVLWLSSRLHTDQEKLGPKDPVAVGATWPVNAAAIIGDHEGAAPSAEQVQGTMKLASVDGEGANQVGTVSGKFTDIATDDAPPPATGKITSSSIVETTITFPLNGQGVFKETLSAIMKETPPPGTPNQPTVSITEKGSQEVTLH